MQQSNNNLNLVDVHAHLDHYKFSKDLDKVIDNAKKAGVKKIITAGITPETNKIALDLSKKYDIVEASFGLYPIDALENESMRESSLKFKPFDIDEQLDWLKKNKEKFIAVGEVGLDLHSGKDIERQKTDFEKIIKVCEEIKKPIIVHSRDAEATAVSMLENSNLKKVVLHCFGGKTELIEKARDNGWFFSIPPIIVRNKNFQKLVKKVNLSQLLTETDCPYLSPVPDVRNEPAFVAETIKKIAKIKQMEDIEVANNIWMNYQNVFA
ncbi:MAG: TatD family hydrolase [Nanoarchaeota archaeon]|nr:TatD family hydrolase [Nanoarchaeota archaeon]